MSPFESPVLAAHPLANLIPEMSPEEYAALKVDIAVRGLLEPVALYEDKILDGRHRYRACVETGSSPTFAEYLGTDPVGYVLARNVHRRHLTASQRAVIALDVERAYAMRAKERQGTRTDLTPTSSQEWEKVDEPEPIHATRKAAQAVGVAHSYVSDAKKVASEAPDLLCRVSNGTMTLPEAKEEIRHRQKAARVAEIAAREPAPLDSLGPFAVVYADPPWRYDNDIPSRSIENHYPTLSLDEIKALPVPAADDAVLFLWATSPKLATALEVMAAWGFGSVKTSAVWVKDSIGCGYYFRQQHEFLLVGKRGHLPVPDPEDRPSSVITAPRGAHSEKPEAAYEAIERMYPTLERVELFARQRRPGWAAWGNQA